MNARIAFDVSIVLMWRTDNRYATTLELLEQRGEMHGFKRVWKSSKNRNRRGAWNRGNKNGKIFIFKHIKIDISKKVMKHIDSMGGQERGKVNPSDLCEDLLKIDRGESAKLKKISRSVAMIARMNFWASEHVTVTSWYKEGIISRSVVVVDGILTDCDQKC